MGFNISARQADFAKWTFKYQYKEAHQLEMHRIVHRFYSMFARLFMLGVEVRFIHCKDQSQYNGWVWDICEITMYDLDKEEFNRLNDMMVR